MVDPTVQPPQITLADSAAGTGQVTATPGTPTEVDRLKAANADLNSALQTSNSNYRNLQSFVNRRDEEIRTLRQGAANQPTPAEPAARTAAAPLPDPGQAGENPGDVLETARRDFFTDLQMDTRIADPRATFNETWAYANDPANRAVVDEMIIRTRTPGTDYLACLHTVHRELALNRALALQTPTPTTASLTPTPTGPGAKTQAVISGSGTGVEAPNTGNLDLEYLKRHPDEMIEMGLVKVDPNDPPDRLRRTAYRPSDYDAPKKE